MTGSPQGASRPRRFYVPPGALEAARIVLAPREAHHIATVLRLRSGARVTVFDGRREADAELDTVTDAAVTARRLGEPRVAARPVDLTLIQGVARGPRMDLVVRMGTEIGLAAIIPAMTARAVSDPGRARVDRWERIAREAARQCGRADLPAISPPLPLGEAIAAAGPVDLFIVPWEHESRRIGEIVAGQRFASAAMLIGPEGGLTEEEVARARAAGGQTVSLGPLILRTETAGLVTASMLLYERLLRTPG